MAKSNEKQDKRIKRTPKEVREQQGKGKYRPRYDTPTEEDEDE